MLNWIPGRNLRSGPSKTTSDLWERTSAASVCVQNAHSVRRRRRPCEKVFLRSIGISRANTWASVDASSLVVLAVMLMHKNFPIPSAKYFCTFVCECTDMMKTWRLKCGAGKVCGFQMHRMSTRPCNRPVCLLRH